MIDTVIFDMDGLMFDTEALAKKAWLVVGKELGLPITDEIVFKVIGMNAVSVRRTCEEHFGPDFDYDAFREKVFRFMQDSFDKEGVPVKPGLPELLAHLRAGGYRTAVASSSSRSVVENYLERAKLGHEFSALICGDMITNGKPAPDIFLKAAETVGAEVQNCLILEDSLNGIRAADAAKMPVIMIPDLIAPTDELREKTVAVYETLHDVIAFLETARKGATV